MSTGFEDFDIHEFIESFRQALSSPESAQEMPLPTMMVTYGQQCEEVNRRLRECAALSQKGMYANAVALAEREPNLLDRCSMLEIPERDILSTVATALGIKAPALLNRDLVETLQETYQKGSSTESNLRILHRLTLARAPLPARLVIMRRLQVQDSNLPYIDADIRTFEKTWFKRAVDFAQPYAKAGNVEVIDEIINDLKENGYLETPPAQLFSGLQQLLAKAQSLQLPILAEEIKSAYREQSLVLLKQLAARWKNLVTQTGVTDAASRYQVTEALTWVNRKLSEESREGERKLAKTRLGNLLANPKAKRQDVIAAYQAAHQLSAIDMMLEAKYEAWTQETGRRQFRNTIGIAAVSAVLLIGGGVGYLQFAPAGPQAIDEQSFVDNLKKLVKDKKYTAALDAAKSAPPQLAENHRVVAIVESATKLEQEAKLYAVAIQALKDATPADDIDALEQSAREKAQDDEELKQVETIVDNLRNRKDGQGAVAKNDFENRLTELRKKTDDLLNRAEKGSFGPQHGDLTEKCSQEFSKLDAVARKQNFDTGGLVDIKTTLDRVTPWKAVASNLSKYSTEMSAASASDESLKRAASFLSSTLAKVHPETKTKLRAKAAEKDLDVWKQALKLKERLQARDVDSQVRQSWAGKPPASAVDAALAPAEMRRHRDFTRPDSGAFKLKERLQSPDIKDAYCIRTELAEPYCYWYTSEPLKAGKDPIEVPVIIDSKGEVLKRTIRGPRKDSELSPQSKLLPELEKLWTDTDPERWHQQLADAYEKLADNSDIDPLLKLSLMRRFLGLAVVSSIGYREILQSIPEFNTINGAAGIVEGNWYNPTISLSKERTRAASLCDKAPRLAKFAADAAKRDKLAESQTSEGIHLVGFLKQNHGGETTLARFSNFTPVSDSTLYVISEGEWIQIGSFPVNKSPKLEDSANQFAGWPVFSVRTSNSE